MNEVVFPKKTVQGVAVSDKTVLVRVDYNVPISSNGVIQDDFRIVASIPTIKYLIEQNAKVILCAHLGRPNGKYDAKLSLSSIAETLSRLLKQEVNFVDDCIGVKVREAVKIAQPGSVTLLENLRFYIGEENNDLNFARQLVKDTSTSLFVQDGFAVSHRASATTVAITKLLPSVAGFLIEKEYLSIKENIKSPARPLITVIGGAKIADKIELLNKFVEISDGVIIGGGIANNFLHYLGFDVGDSLYEPNADAAVKYIIGRARNKFGSSFLEKFILPVDLAISSNGAVNSKREESSLLKESSNTQFKIFDVGANSIDRIKKLLSNASTVIWNGTLGFTEEPQWSRGSVAVAEVLSNNPKIYSLVGGGDTSSFAHKFIEKTGGAFTFISTGGGASLELMAGKDLPGINSLENSSR